MADGTPPRRRRAKKDDIINENVDIKSSPPCSDNYRKGGVDGL